MDHLTPHFPILLLIVQHMWLLIKVRRSNRLTAQQRKRRIQKASENIHDSDNDIVWRNISNGILMAFQMTDARWWTARLKGVVQDDDDWWMDKRLPPPLLVIVSFLSPLLTPHHDFVTQQAGCVCFGYLYCLLFISLLCSDFRPMSILQCLNTFYHEHPVLTNGFSPTVLGWYSHHNLPCDDDKSLYFLTRPPKPIFSCGLILPSGYWKSVLNSILK